ncbi:MAG: hypothetical protein QOE61_5140, partial [Micromonosporaceae bacterium]|nr:hypothetical protein [Micromonosporaceae bacterium]
MNQFFEQVPTLLGVVVGALASYFVAAATERRRWRRAFEVRWDERRVIAYADYGSAVKAMFDCILRLRDENQRPMIDRNKLTDELRAAGRERAAKWETVLLLGTRAAIEAGRSWHQTIWTLQDFVFDLRSGDDEWEDSLRASATARSDFYLAARKDLGLRDPSLPEEPAIENLVQALRAGGLP